MASLPSISIVVPTLNGAATLAQTLQSLVDQHYPRLQIVVIDGGSTDASVEIIQRFQPNIDFWMSEKDSGQSSAINKGFARCTGEIVNWLCSDDLLAPGALRRVGQAFADDPTLDVLVGACKIIGVHSGSFSIQRADPRLIALMPVNNCIPQPSCFYKRSLLQRQPPVLESLHLAMDFELWCCFHSQGAKFGIIDDLLSICQMTGRNKTYISGERVVPELDRIYRSYCPRERIPLIFWHRRLRFPVERFRQNRRHPLPRLLAQIYIAAFSRVFGLFYGVNRVKNMNWEWMFHLPA